MSKAASIILQQGKKGINEYPNGIRLRFVKPYNEAVSTNEKSKINLLRTTTLFNTNYSQVTLSTTAALPGTGVTRHLPYHT